MTRRLNRPSIPEVLPLLREYLAREGNYLGGLFHGMLDDGNIENSSALWCVEHADPTDELETKIAVMLAAMTRTQRGRISRGFHSEPLRAKGEGE